MYEKRLCILKQIKKGFSADGSPLTGAVYAERLGTELILTPKLAGLSALTEGRYALSVWVGGKVYCLELKGNEALRVPDSPSLKDGFAALLCFVRGEAEPIAHGFCGSAPCEREILLNVFYKKEKMVTVQESREQPAPQEEESVPQESAEEHFPENAPFCDIAAEESQTYDDEAIASSDYFGEAFERTQNADAVSQDQEESAEEKDRDAVCPHEADETYQPFRLSRGGLTYYRKVAPKLSAAMRKFPRDERLEAVFPNSQWVRAENAVLGVIYAEGLPRYLCVAMEQAPPEEVKEASVFVPVSPFTETEGYYVVFQDADSGDYVKVENA